MEEAKKQLFWIDDSIQTAFIRSTGSYSASSETSNNGSCIDTGIIPTATMEFEFIVRVTPGASVQHWPYLFGAQGSNDNIDTVGLRGNSLHYASSSTIGRPWSLFRFGHSNWSDLGDGTETWSGSEAWHLIYVSKSKVEIDGVACYPTQSDSSRYSTYSIVVGSIHRGNSFTNCIPHDLKTIKIWDNNILICNMVPGVVDGKAGMIDLARDKAFFQSAVSTRQYQFFDE